MLTVDQAPKENTFGTRFGTFLQEYFITVSSQLNRKKSIIGLKIGLKVPFLALGTISTSLDSGQRSKYT